MAADEHVLCVPRAGLDAIAPIRGFVTGSARWLSPLLAHHATLRRRDAGLERDGSWLQLVAYVLVMARPGPAARVLAYARPAAGGDPRLAGRASLGLGGHVAESDLAGGTRHEAIRRAGLRELDEELAYEAPDGPERAIPPSTRGTLADFRRVGLLFDESDPVGRVHLGIVYQAWVDRPEGRYRLVDPAARPLGFLDPAAPPAAAWESWSAILLADLFRPPSAADVPARPALASDGIAP